MEVIKDISIGLFTSLFGKQADAGTTTVDSLNAWAEKHCISDNYKFNDDNINTMQRFSLIAYWLEPDFRKIKHLPDAICELSNLEMLEIGKVWSLPDLYCDLVELPAKIGNLKKLKYLHLQFQSIETLPNDICRLENLKALKLGGNNLKTLPDDIGNLSQLETLTMWDNKIDRLPASIINLTNLKELDLSSNPIECKKLSQPIIKWMKDLQKNGCNIEFNNDYIQFSHDIESGNSYKEEILIEPDFGNNSSNEKISDLCSYDEVDEQLELEVLLDEYGIEYIYHITHYKNVKDILENGLLPHTNNLVKETIDNKDVNSRRNKSDSVFYKNIHSYVPFYFNPKNPMLFAKKDIQEDIVILAFSRDLMMKKKAIFTDGNAAVTRTNFYSELSDLSELNWDCLNAPYWSDFENGKSERMAEILVRKKVKIKHLEKIYCFDEETLLYIKDIHDYLEIEINKAFYF